MELAEMISRAEYAMLLLRHYAAQYALCKMQGRKTHMKAKMIRRRMATIKAWLDAIELQLQEDEEQQ